LSYALFDFNDRGWSDDHLPRVVDAAQLLGFTGLNVTYPFKQAVIPLLDELADGARAVGAVNTISFDGGKRIGHNTDVTGFAESFRGGLPDVRNAHVLQVGCGGAGASTAHALLTSGSVDRLYLFDITPERAHSLHDQLISSYGGDRVATVTDLSATAAMVDGIVNATPIGMVKFPGLPLPADALESRHWVADIVYFPLETALLAEARAKGCRVVNGSGMAIHQAADAFEIFTGRTADKDRMRASFSTESPRAVCVD
jgi:shikimate dehydrogenase